MTWRHERQTSLERLMQRILGDWYPLRYVVAVVRPEQAQKLLQVIKDSNYSSNQVLLRSADEVRHAVCPVGPDRSVFRRLMDGYVQTFGWQGEACRSYSDAAEHGWDIVAVETRNDEEIEPLARLLYENGAREVRYYSLFQVVDLFPEQVRA